MKNPHAVALGRLGGRKGGPAGGRARAKSLSARRRSEIARAAALARWGRLPDRLRPLFPGYHLEDIRLPDHIDVVMLHVLTWAATRTDAGSYAALATKAYVSGSSIAAAEASWSVT